MEVWPPVHYFFIILLRKLLFFITLVKAKIAGGSAEWLWLFEKNLE